MRLEQKFASKIYEQVTDYKKEKADKNIYKRYGSMAYTLPILVRTAGLAQALSFVESKSKQDAVHPYTYLLNHLAEVVIEEKNGKKLAEQSRSADLKNYMYLTRRTMLALKWYKRFAESVLDVTSTTKMEDGGENG
jgi:CRISPR-associated protein Cmr5